MPVFGARPVEHITGSDVARFHDRIGRETPIAANRAVAVLSTMMSLAERWGLRARGTNPVRGLERYREHKRRRHLGLDEVARLGRTLDDTERDVTVSVFAIAALRLLLYTGCRRSEILTTRWEHVDLDAGVLGLPDSKTERKAKLDDVVLHDLRRTHASIAINSGLTLDTVGGLLGHRTAQTTRGYAYLSTGTLKAAAAVVGDTLSAAISGTRRMAAGPLP